MITRKLLALGLLFVLVFGLQAYVYAATTFTFQCTDPSGAPTTLCEVHMDPDFHHGDPGTLLFRATVAGKYTIPMPSGAHKLVVLGSARVSTGTNTSVMVFNTAPGTACQSGWAPIGYQSWWLASSGEALPGRHAHIDNLCWPANNKIVSGTLSFRLNVQLHAQPTGAKLTRVRLKDYPGGVDRWVAAKPYPQPDARGNLVTTFTATINTGSLSAGRHEFRWGIYVTQPDGKVQLLSTRSEICIRSCSPVFRSGNYQGNGSWYANDSIGYEDTRIYSPFPVSP